MPFALEPYGKLHHARNTIYRNQQQIESLRNCSGIHLKGCEWWNLKGVEKLKSAKCNNDAKRYVDLTIL
jgi:hypothetical protein